MFNYIGMSGDPHVTEESKRAMELYGSSASASRIAGGERTIHAELERAISDLLGVEDCMLMLSGVVVQGWEPWKSAPL